MKLFLYAALISSHRCSNFTRMTAFILISDSSVTGQAPHDIPKMLKSTQVHRRTISFRKFYSVWNYFNSQCSNIYVNKNHVSEPPLINSAAIKVRGSEADSRVQSYLVASGEVVRYFENFFNFSKTRPRHRGLKFTRRREEASDLHANLCRPAASLRSRITRELRTWLPFVAEDHAPWSRKIFSVRLSWLCDFAERSA